jgi:hypothetical protein
MVNPNFEDYAADGVFHGLRTLLGADAVDFPKAEYLYDTITPEMRSRIRGNGFTLYGLLPDLPIDRDHILFRALAGEFDLVIFGDIWRTFGMFTEWGPQLADAGVPMAIFDGSDRPEPYPYAGVWWRRKGWWFLPRAHTRAPYYKREVTRWTRWFGTYLAVPPPLNAFRMRHLRPLAFSIPENLIVSGVARKTREFSTHTVDAEVAARLQSPETYAFDVEADYVADLRSARYGVTTKRQGWDALRHYEIAAAGAVPCFRSLQSKPAGCAPHGLDPGRNCIAYRTADDLFRQVAAIGDAAYDRLREGAIRWARANTTIVRAEEILSDFGLDSRSPR